MADDANFPAGKREQTKVQNRQAILDAAREVFGELGYETATVRDIIRRTGLAAGTFYNYYRSKEEVFAALSEEGARRFTPILRAIRTSAPDFDTFVREALEAYFEFMADEHRSWLARRPPGEPHPHVTGQTPESIAVFEEVRDAIVAAVAAGKGQVTDLDYMTVSCIGIAREVGDKMLERRPIDTRAAADFAMNMILFGLNGPSSGKD
jgi:AcrR family transcriptional regulator